MSTDRRSFIKGLLVSTSAAASTALVKLASPEDVKALEVAKPAVIGQPFGGSPESRYLASGQYHPLMSVGQPVYMRSSGSGKLYEVGILTEITMWADKIDVTMATDDPGAQHYVRGLDRSYGRFLLTGMREA